MGRDSVGTSADNPVRSAAHGIDSLIALRPEKLQYWRADKFCCQKSEDHLSQQMQAQLLSSQGESCAWRALGTFTWCSGRCKLERIRLQKGWSGFSPLSPHLCPALDSPLQERHCKVQEISKTPQRWLGLKHLPGEQRTQRSCEISPWPVKKSNGWGAEQPDFSWPFFEKGSEKGAVRVHFQPRLSCASVHHEELLFQSSNKNSGHWCDSCFWTKLKKKKQGTRNDVMVKATDQLMETINKQVFSGQWKGTKIC